MELPTGLPLRASGVKRLVGRFFRLPLPRNSAAASATAFEDEEDEEEEDVAANASRACISSGEIHRGADEEEDWAKLVEPCLSAGGRA